MEKSHIENAKIDIQAQTEEFKKRVDFLHEWRNHLQKVVANPESTAKEVFEAKDKIYSLEVEIASKQGLINMRLKDIEQMDKQMKAIDNEVKANYVPTIEKLKKLKLQDSDTLTPAIIKGVVDRSKTNISMAEMAKDYKLAKSILMAVESKQSEVANA